MSEEAAKGTDGAGDEGKPTGTEDKNAELLKELEDLRKFKEVNQAKLDEANKLIDERKKASTQREAEMKQKEQYRDLFEVSEKKLTEMQKQLDELKPKAEQADKLQAEISQYQETRKSELLERIPEDKRAAWKDSDVSILEKVVNTFGGETKTRGGPSTATRGAGGGNPEKPFAEMTADELSKAVQGQGRDAIVQNSADYYRNQMKEKNN